MTSSSRWFDRTFAFDMPVTLAPNVVERLRGTPARVEELTHGVAPERLVLRIDGTWSAQENAGHLLDLEPLWLSRLDDFVAGRTQLSAADLSNRRTDEANHNARGLGEILAEFRASRGRFVHRLEGAEESFWTRTAQHPRLGTPMRLLDSAFFVAEHDDHHLARIRQLLRAIT